jgi:beta-glucosidase
MAKLKYQNIIEKMTLEEKVALCSGANNWTTKAFEQHGIPSIRMADGPHGLRKQKDDGDEPGEGKSIPATCFPAACATACSWDRDLMVEMGKAIGEEALQEGVSIVLGPGINIKRNPLCGRNFEYFSEDPYLAGELAAHWIQGVQSQGVGTSLKHFAANNQENLRLQSDSIMDERTLREIYLTAFEIAVKQAEPLTVMCAYNLLNGVFCSDHVRLLRTILREEWGFKGLVMSDWGALNDKSAGFKAGLDLEMPGGVGYFDPMTIRDVQNGALSEDYLNESVDRILSMVFECHKKLKANYRYDVEAHHQLARKAAAQSAVLLKNEENILPLAKELKFAVIGALAEQPRYQGAGSSFINPTFLNSGLDGLKAYQAQTNYFPGYHLKESENETLLQEAVAGARDNDVALVYIGLTEDYESEGFDRRNLRLPPSHNRLVEAVAQANPNTVVLLFGGAPVELPWLPRVKAVLNMYLPGQAGGLAAADLLFGAANPCGKLAESYPLAYEDVPSAGFYLDGGKQAQYREGLYVGYRYYDKAHKKVAFPFGFGLSYSTFSFENLTVSKKKINVGETLTVCATIRNTGRVAGAEVVQLYIRYLKEETYRPEKELKGFVKVFLQPGEERQVTFTLELRSFAIYDAAAMDWVVPGGEYAVCLAASSRDVRLEQIIQVSGDKPNQQTPLIPQWYRTPNGQATQADLEALLGHEIPAVVIAHKGTYDLDCSMRDMRRSFIIRMVIRYYEWAIGQRFGGVNYDNPNFKMAMETSMTTPLKKLITTSNGELTPGLAQALVNFANGRLWQGLKALFGNKKIP